MLVARPLSCPWLVAFGFALTVLAAAPVARAEDGTGDRPQGHAPGIALAEVVQLAEVSAPAVLVRAARVRSAEAEVGVAGAFRNPQVLLGATSATAELIGGVTMSLPVFGQRGAAKDAARATVREAEVDAAIVRADARLAATLAWVDLWLAEKAIALAVDDDGRLERLRAAAQERFEQGAGPRIDVLRAEADARRARAEAHALEAQRDATSSQLAVLLGRDPAVTLATAGEPPAAPLEHPTVDAAVAQHPLVARARARLGTAGAVVERERRAQWPLLSVSIQEWYHERSPDTPDVVDDLRGLVSFDVPLFGGAVVDRATLQEKAARVEADAAKADARADVVRARSLYLAADQRCRAAVDDVLPFAREAADLALEAYRSGALDLTATLGAAQSFSAAKLAGARASADRARAAATLDRIARRAP